MPQIRLTNSTTNQYSWELNTKQTVYYYSFEICTLMGYYKMFSGITLKMFRDSLSVPFSVVKTSWFLKMGSIGCPTVPVRNYHHMLHNIPQECKSHPLRGQSLKSHLLIYFTLWYYLSALNSFMIIQAAYKYSCPVHTEIANKMQQFIKIYYSMFIWSSTCFGRHTTRHQELKNCTSSRCPATTTSNSLSHMQNQRLLVQFLSSWWRVVCSPKHVQLHINME